MVRGAAFTPWQVSARFLPIHNSYTQCWLRLSPKRPPKISGHARYLEIRDQLGESGEEGLAHAAFFYRFPPFFFILEKATLPGCSVLLLLLETSLETSLEMLLFILSYSS